MSCDSTRRRHKGRPRAGKRGRKRVLCTVHTACIVRFHVRVAQARLVREEAVPEPSPLPPPDELLHDVDPLAELSAAHSDQVAEVVLRMLDWMGVSKNTWTSAEGVWDMLRELVPDAADYPVFSHVKKILVDYMNDRVDVIPICVNNCMAFYDCKSAGYSGAEWQTANDDFCCHCGEDRWLRPNIYAPTGTNRKVPPTRAGERGGDSEGARGKDRNATPVVAPDVTSGCHTGCNTGCGTYNR